MGVKKHTAILILFLSDYKIGNTEEKYYYSDSPEKFELGVQTNDAPVKYLLRAAHEHGNEIGTVFCLTSQEVYRKTIDGNGRSAYGKFGDMVTDFCNSEELYKPDIYMIRYDFNVIKDGQLTEVDDKARAMYIYRQIVDALEAIDSDTVNGSTEAKDVYIDYTGGLRDTSFLMTTIIRYFEFNNVVCRKIVYSKYSRTELDNNRIYDIGYVYDMFQMINGVNEFVTTGNARQLAELFDVKQDVNTPEQEFLRNIIRFSNAISLCNISELDKAKEAISESIKKLEVVGLKSEMLFSLLPLVKRKMYLDEEGISYPNMIRWCVDNDMLQQAITIYIEKMPIYYGKDGIDILPDFVEEAAVQGGPGRSGAGERFYTVLYDSIAEGVSIQKMKNTLKQILQTNTGDIENGNDFIDELENRNIDRAVIQRMQNYLSTDVYLNNTSATIGAYGDFRVRCKDLKEFLVNLSDGRYLKLLHYFVINNRNKYNKIPKKHGRNDMDSYTYRKKAYAVKQLASGGVNLPYAEELCNAMKYYLVLKVIRNRMNHASENDDTNDELAVIQEMNGYGIRITNHYSDVKKILLDALQVLEA